MGFEQFISGFLLMQNLEYCHIVVIMYNVNVVQRYDTCYTVV